jgi:hypothetical protein
MNNNDIKFSAINSADFFENSVNPKNTDSIVFNKGIKIDSGKDLLKVIQKDNDKSLLLTINSLLKTFFLVKNEYLISISNSYILTNRRYFIHINDNKKLSIPLNKITSYKEENGQFILRYSIDNEEKMHYLSKWLTGALVNNIIQEHNRDIDFQDENIIALISNFKDELSFNNDIDIKADNYPIKSSPNYTGIIMVCLVFLFIGGCVYFVEKDSNIPTKTIYTNSGDPSHDQNGNKRKKCPWCGGVGKVGYLGESKAQVEKTGMGLGNFCITCNGTGYVDDK